MLALSIRQPYAWLIVRPDITHQFERAARIGTEIKDVENRGWPTKVRGTVLIHAAKTYGKREHADDYKDFRSQGWPFPAFQDLELGGIVGQADIVDCVHDHPSRWTIHGNWQFVLANAKPLPFRPFKGALGFFNVPEEVTE